MYNIHLSRCESCGASPGEKHNEKCSGYNCKFCGGDLRIRNPTGKHDHLYGGTQKAKIMDELIKEAKAFAVGSSVLLELTAATGCLSEEERKVFVMGYCMAIKHSKIAHKIMDVE